MAQVAIVGVALLGAVGLHLGFQRARYASSFFKNRGGMEVLSWCMSRVVGTNFCKCLGFRTKFPYRDIETIKKLKAKALVYSM